MRMSEKCRNHYNSDNPLTSRRTDGGKIHTQNRNCVTCGFDFTNAYISVVLAQEKRKLFLVN